MNTLNTPAERLEYALNTAMFANAFNGFDAAEFDFDAYELEQANDDMHGFDGYDVIELTEHYSPSAAGDRDSDEPWDGFNSDAEADADVLANAGWGTDEDYGYYGEE